MSIWTAEAGFIDINCKPFRNRLEKVGDRSQTADDKKLFRIMKRRDRHNEEQEGLAIRTNNKWPLK